MAEQDLVVAFSQGFFLSQGDVAEVAPHLDGHHLLDRLHRGQLDRLRHRPHLRALIGLVHFGEQVIQVVEGGHAPAFVLDQTANDAALVNVGSGSLQFFAAEDHARGLFFFDADFSVVGFTVFERFLNSVSHIGLLFQNLISRKSLLNRGKDSKSSTFGFRK